ncbi:prepilin peptidase [Anoxybacillus flavithermus]|uniref:Prepilin peptidase n=1 Tax=Anoxybacillus flavithermus TaxID=33934 RepID=A0AAX2A2S4_9BACL|nr:A24 family peptidase [Anoxybacillus flavithermus]MBE2904321.1 prepilin peptidase [Anoxybacillus flavithermus]MBE2909648.1 prepilin peptidase [Anoxybacillus flavithermus]MBE2914969.1 prepilin peptidase [Anoxybacillus flavithermus]MBE2926080.1 prepilin peptidase [Anoxybacillus flavithermus]MBE2928450.1 prepilin peptidase [Anoxybacillus flavithermus]
MLFFISFLLGLFLGSFYNVVGLRVPKGESIVAPRSHCPHCKRTLTAFELIPVVSYVLQKGKCRACSARISFFYPFVELSTAILFTLAPLFVGWSAEIVVSWTLISLFVIIFVSDVHYMVIPNRILLFFAPLLLIERITLAPLTPWWDSLLGSFVGFMMLFLIALVSKGGMGGGDIKLFAVIGLALGVKLTVLAFFLSTFVGTMFGLIGMAIGHVKRGEPMPFGPAIVVGTLIAYFFGEAMIDMYVKVMM